LQKSESGGSHLSHGETMFLWHTLPLLQDRFFHVDCVSTPHNTNDHLCGNHWP